MGLAFAFLIELVLNRSVKRPLEVETLLGIPLLLSIPYLNGRNHLRLRWPRADRSSILALQGIGHSHLRRRGSPITSSGRFRRPYETVSFSISSSID